MSKLENFEFLKEGQLMLEFLEEMHQQPKRPSIIRRSFEMIRSHATKNRKQSRKPSPRILSVIRRFFISCWSRICRCSCCRADTSSFSTALDLYFVMNTCLLLGCSCCSEMTPSSSPIRRRLNQFMNNLAFFDFSSPVRSSLLIALFIMRSS